MAVGTQRLVTSQPRNVAGETVRSMLDHGCAQLGRGSLDQSNRPVSLSECITTTSTRVPTGAGDGIASGVSVSCGVWSLGMGMKGATVAVMSSAANSDAT